MKVTRQGILLNFRVTLYVFRLNTCTLLFRSRLSGKIVGGTLAIQIQTCLKAGFLKSGNLSFVPDIIVERKY